MAKAMLKLAAAAALLGAAAPGMAAQGLDCIRDGLDAATRARLEQAAVARLARNGAPSQDQKERDDIAAFDRATQQCGVLHKWSEAASNEAIGYSITRMLMDGLDGALTDAGADLSLLAAYANAHPDIPTLKQPYTPELRAATIAGLRAAGIPIRDAEIEGKLLNYLRAYVLHHVHRKAFEAA